MFKIPLSEIAQLTSWTWQHRKQLAGVPQDAEEFVETVLSDKGAGVHRAGSTLRHSAPDGTSKVLAFLGQAAHQLTDIEKAISDGTDPGQQALAGVSLRSLQNISMVTLGLSAMTPLILAS